MMVFYNAIDDGANSAIGAVGNVQCACGIAQKAAGPKARGNGGPIVT